MRFWKRVVTFLMLTALLVTLAPGTALAGPQKKDSKSAKVEVTSITDPVN